MQSDLESRIRKWVDVQRNHPGRPPRETSVDWIIALLDEVDQLRNQLKEPRS